MEVRNAFLRGTGAATVICASIFKPVTDNAAAAMIAGRRQGVYRAFETVKRVAVATKNHFERFVIVVAANVAFRHENNSISGRM